MPTPLSTFSESLHTTKRSWSLALQCYRRCWWCKPSECRHPPGEAASEANATGLSGNALPIARDASR